MGFSMGEDFQIGKVVDLHFFTHRCTHTHTHFLTKVKNLKFIRNTLCEFKEWEKIQIQLGGLREIECSQQEVLLHDSHLPHMTHL